MSEGGARRKTERGPQRRRMCSQMSRLASALTVAATIAAHVPPLLFGWLEPGYRWTRDYISELGANGAAHAGVVNATFLAAGLLAVAACAAMRRALPSGAAAAGGLALVSLIGVSWIVAGVSPCDVGCPAAGSLSQAVHNTVGLLGYLGGASGLLWLGTTLKRTGAHWHAAVTTACGVVALAALAVHGRPRAGRGAGPVAACGRGRGVRLDALHRHAPGGRPGVEARTAGRSTSARSAPRPASSPA